MLCKIINPMDIKEALVADLTKAFGNNLLSVVMFGSAATERYVPGKSDINIILIVKDESVQALSGLNRLEKKWKCRKVVFSFFFTSEYINNSLDSYPLEFLEIQKEHLLLHGNDFFKDLKVSRMFLRLQCERELKGKLLHLKREFIRRHHKKRYLQELLKISFPQFIIIFRGVLYSSGLDFIPKQTVDAIKNLRSTLNVDTSILNRISSNQIPSDYDRLNGFFIEYIRAVESISNAVDKMKTNQ